MQQEPDIAGGFSGPFQLQFVWITASGHVKLTHLLWSAKNLHAVHEVT
jgi:hypothetical protein